MLIFTNQLCCLLSIVFPTWDILCHIGRAAVWEVCEGRFRLGHYAEGAYVLYSQLATSKIRIPCPKWQQYQKNLCPIFTTGLLHIILQLHKRTITILLLQSATSKQLNATNLYLSGGLRNLSRSLFNLYLIRRILLAKYSFSFTDSYRTNPA